MRKSFLPFSPPLIGEDEIAEVVDTLRSGWLTSGPKTELFEQRFAEFVGAPAALAVNSCTAALHLALLTGDLGPGDEVITTPMTFVATVNVIEHVGARPVLVDVEPDTLNIAAARVADVVTERTRAVLPVHYAGHPVDMDAIHAIAGEHSLAVIEDAAHALCAKHRGRPIGSGNNLAAFSFYATKNLTTGEGGMLTGDAEALERARALSLHGMSRDAWRRYDTSGNWYYEVEHPGFKYNMTEIQASIGLHQLAKLAEFQRRRRAVVQRYDEAFSGLDCLEIPTTRPEMTNAHHLYVLRLRPEHTTIARDALIDGLHARNIGTSVHFIPVHLHPYYRDKYGWRPEDFPVAIDAYRRMLSLPLSPTLSERDVEDVIDAVERVLRS
ncbi:MAG: DegT/DnrJ/EryC1/StrS aminotransferase family protein [Acidobacteriota bacterium]|jgi:dTDP-4-amino-4,6-dideoxygalactose transaminase